MSGDDKRAGRSTRLARLGGTCLPPLARHVVARGLAGDHVEPVVHVDEGDEADQRAELVLVVVLDGVVPGVVTDAVAVGDAGALLGQLERGPLGLGEDLGLAPGGDQVEPLLGLPGVQGVLGVHVEAAGAAVDLAGPNLDQLLGGGGQGRGRHRPAGGVDVLGELGRHRVAVEVQAGFHGWVSPRVSLRLHRLDTPAGPDVTRSGPRPRASIREQLIIDQLLTRIAGLVESPGCPRVTPSSQGGTLLPADSLSAARRLSASRRSMLKKTTTGLLAGTGAVALGGVATQSRADAATAATATTPDWINVVSQGADPTGAT